VEHGDRVINQAVWPGNDVSRYNLTDFRGSCCAGFDGSADSAYFASDDRSYETGVDAFIADKLHVSGFDHGIGSFDHRHHAAAFNQSQCFFHDSSLRLFLREIQDQARETGGYKEFASGSPVYSIAFY
jgi:hypothetical protein